MSVDWGLTASIGGLALSGLGFGVTINQLARTARATEAVKKAVSNLRNRISTFDYVAECMNAGRSLQHATQLLRLRQWQDAAATLLDAQATLNRVASSLEGNPEVKSSAGQAVENLLETVGSLEEAADKEIDYDPSQLITTLRKLTNQLDTEVIGASRGIYDV